MLRSRGHPAPVWSEHSAPANFTVLLLLLLQG
jgi:hypothetical protein